MKQIDLNSDLGEGFGRWKLGDDEAMLSLVSSANIACGFHAGDPAGLLAVLQKAADRGVAVGAHIAYRDLVGFGRRLMVPSRDELIGDAIYQIGALSALARAAGTRVRYVKPHGALYNTIADDPGQAEAVIQAIMMVDPSLPLVARAGAAIIRQARVAGLTIVAEAFADRAINADGTLVNRHHPGAVLTDSHQISDRVLRLIEEGRMTAIDGTDIEIRAQTICLHGDTPHAVSVAADLRHFLDSSDVMTRSFINMSDD